MSLNQLEENILRAAVIFNQARDNYLESKMNFYAQKKKAPSSYGLTKEKTNSQKKFDKLHEKEKHGLNDKTLEEFQIGVNFYRMSFKNL